MTEIPQEQPATDALTLLQAAIALGAGIKNLGDELRERHDESHIDRAYMIRQIDQLSARMAQLAGDFESRFLFLRNQLDRHRSDVEQIRQSQIGLDTRHRQGVDIAALGFAALRDDLNKLEALITNTPDKETAQIRALIEEDRQNITALEQQVQEILAVLSGDEPAGLLDQMIGDGG